VLLFATKEIGMNNSDFGELTRIGAKPLDHYRIDMLCPHCGYFSPAEGAKLSEKYYGITCHRCKESVMIHTGDEKQIVDYYPKRKVTVDNALVPEEIAKDFLEAHKCFSVAAWQACSVMARRCIHLVAEIFSAEGKDLYQQIEDLKNKQLITPVLAEAAQRVRALGKHGAHPYDGKGNAFNDLEMEDARLGLEFCEFIFDQLFIQPAKIAASKQKIR